MKDRLGRTWLLTGLLSRVHCRNWSISTALPAGTTSGIAFSSGRDLGRRRSNPEKMQSRRQRHADLTKKEPEIAVVLSSPISCPKCGKQERTKHRLFSRIVYDLVFGRNSVKGRIVKYTAQTYRCGSCGHDYGLHDACFHGYKWGLNLFRDIFPAARCVLLICFLSTTNTPQLAAGIFYCASLLHLPYRGLACSPTHDATESEQAVRLRLKPGNFA
jgi:hypothetical protein